MVGVAEELRPGGRRAKDSAYALAAQIDLQAAAVGDEADQRGGYVSVEVVDDKDRPSDRRRGCAPRARRSPVGARGGDRGGQDASGVATSKLAMIVRVPWRM